MGSIIHLGTIKGIKCKVPGIVPDLCNFSNPNEQLTKTAVVGSISRSKLQSSTLQPQLLITKILPLPQIGRLLIDAQYPQRQRTYRGYRGWHAHCCSKAFVAEAPQTLMSQ